MHNKSPTALFPTFILNSQHLAEAKASNRQSSDLDCLHSGVEAAAFAALLICAALVATWHSTLQTAFAQTAIFQLWQEVATLNSGDEGGCDNSARQQKINETVVVDDALAPFTEEIQAHDANNQLVYVSTFGHIRTVQFAILYLKLVHQSKAVACQITLLALVQTGHLTQ